MTFDKRTNAVCSCGTKFCMDCFQSPCWPAPCVVTKKYWDAVKTKGVDISQTEEDFTTSVPEIVIQGKLCPNCNRLTEKDGGCYFVYCVCGVGFCWGCRGMFREHHTRIEFCDQDSNGELFRTTTKRILLNQHLEENMKGESRLLQLAVNQRSERASSKREGHWWGEWILRALGWKFVSKVADSLTGTIGKERTAQCRTVFAEHDRFVLSDALPNWIHRCFGAAEHFSPRTSRFRCIVGSMEGRAADLRSHLDQDARVTL